MEFENNAFFWQKLDTLLMSSTLVINRPKGAVHPEFHNLIYPIDYGYLTGDEDFRDHIGVYKGSRFAYRVDSVVVCADILKKDIEVKLLVGCTEEEVKLILEFLNQTDYQKTVILRRGNDIPNWAVNG